MNMTIDLTEILTCVITVIGALVVRYLIPLLKEKLDDAKLDKLEKAVNIAVYAAEQTIGPGKGAEKKQAAQDYLRERGYNVDLAEVDAAIEAAVKGLKIAIKEKEKA